VLHVAAARTALEPQGLLVGDAVAIAVAVDVEVVGVRLADDDAVIERSMMRGRSSLSANTVCLS
jgi:hypothetical protein